MKVKSRRPAAPKLISTQCLPQDMLLSTLLAGGGGILGLTLVELLIALVGMLVVLVVGRLVLKIAWRLVTIAVVVVGALLVLAQFGLL